MLGGIPFLEKAVRLLAEGVIDPSPIIDSVLPSERFGDALAALAAGRTRRPKIVLDFADAASAALPQEES